MPWARFKLWAINAFVALAVAFMLVDSLPQSPEALKRAIQPIVQPLGIQQGPWSMFAPTPDRLNIQVSAEITYRDGQQAIWTTPEWREQPLGKRWVMHRHQEFSDTIIMQESMPALEPWMRHLARSLRPDLEHADRGAEVRVLYREAEVPPAADRPWTTWRQPPQVGETSILTIEKFP
jgi:hypothetical protein